MASTCTRNSSDAGAPAAARRAAAPGCGPPSGRPARTSTRRPSPASAAARHSSAASSSAARSACRLSAVRASAAATPGPSSSSSSGRTRCRTRARVNRGSTLCGSSQASMPSAAQAASVCFAGDAEQRAPELVERGPHPGDRAATGAAGQPEQHGLGLVVEGVAEQHDAGPHPVGDLVEHGVPRLPGRGLDPAAARVDVHPDRHGLVRPERGHLGDDPVGVRSAEPSCRPWSTMAPTTCQPDSRASKTVAASRASESAPPEQATTTTSPGPTSARARRTPRRTAATAGCRVMRGLSRTRDTQADGSAISALLGRFSGRSQTALNSAMPTLPTTWRTNTAPSRYCAILASSPSSRRRIRSRVPTPLRRWSKLRRMSATVGMTLGPTPSITTSACPSSSDITPVTRSTMAFCSGVPIASIRLVPPPPLSASVTRLKPSSSSVVGSRVSAMACISPKRWSRIHGTAVNCTRWVSSCRHTQSRKSCGSAPSSRSTCTMLGATSSSRPDGSKNGSNWPSTLPARKPSSAPTSAPVTREPTARASPVGRALLRGELLDDRPEDRGEPVRVGLDPARPVDDQDRGGAVVGDQAGELADQPGRPVGARAQLGDGGGGVLAADAGPSPAIREPSVTARSQSTRPGLMRSPRPGGGATGGSAGWSSWTDRTRLGQRVRAATGRSGRRRGPPRARRAPPGRPGCRRARSGRPSARTPWGARRGRWRPRPGR